ncbi:hypothetical protein Jiend_20950 [Micromonospora endophytica]|nr:hypothetical protein Jiend_20950 [Micromonospora endophytica]
MVAEGTTVTEETGPWLVAGLGNPGREYAGNRHNVGFMVADLLADRLDARFGRYKRVMADVAEGRLGFGGPKLVLLKPLTYMNLSGGRWRAWPSSSRWRRIG